MSKPTKVDLRVFSYALFGILIFTAASPVSRAQAATAKAVSDSTRRVLFDNGAFSGPEQALPHWDNGYLVSRAVETFEPGTSNVKIYDQSGKLARQAAIWFPEALRVLVYSATAAADGRIIVGGKAEKADGSAGLFIARTNLAGDVTDVIQANDFAPSNVCQAPDGTVWSFGSTGYDATSRPKPGNVLRHFDFHKGEIGSYLSRLTFPAKPGPDILAYLSSLLKNLSQLQL